MKVAFRVDASNQIGTGHFMRCLTLADALKQRGEETRFVSRHLPHHLKDALASRGHQFTQLNGHTAESGSDDLAHSLWLGTSQRLDAQDTLRVLADQEWDWLVVDHYALDARWEAVLRQRVSKILVIDDIADRQHDCDVLLDQNFYSDMDVRYTEKVSPRCQLFLGPRYALLRDEFTRLREQARPRTQPVQRVLIFFGGVDVGNHTAKAIEAIARTRRDPLHVDVVIGLQHPYRDEIAARCAAAGFVCHVQTDRMAELMAAADLAVGAGGSAAWERCSLGLPCLVAAVAQNQVQAAKDLSSLGAAKYIGNSADVTVENLQRALASAGEDGWLTRASSIGLALVDAHGVYNIINRMKQI